MSRTAADLVAAARQTIAEISAETLAGEPKNDSILIDVREPGEYAEGHLPGAINIPRGVLEFQIGSHPVLADIPTAELQQKSIVLYCRTGGRSALATASLQQLGFGNLCSLAGGFDAWSATGQSVER
ncbi:MAG: rhodanese-like domain-containing protein [Xanthomonadaceae bacterium]|nr:rhodanese-like domain-containing protein [Xanthomonadaceae bacterium]